MPMKTLAGLFLDLDFKKGTRLTFLARPTRDIRDILCCKTLEYINIIEIKPMKYVIRSTLLTRARRKFQLRSGAERMDRCSSQF